MNEEKERLIEEIDTVYNNVVSILHKYPASRNDDRVLLILYWKLINNIDFNKLNDLDEVEIKKLTNYETIRRSRCRIQNELRLLQPSEETKIKRRIKEHAFREWSK